METPINECTHCGSNEGYYIKQYAFGSIKQNFNFDGSEADNTEMYQHLNHKGGSVAYCSSCNKKIFNMSI
ncbi:hypothetical protein AM501_09950 [Aneurinibacillus migulanus]|uniref:hypothetical protein n=1 Tax=Aneurinibacillus migulanus TaxID=47500 RepID=UPI0005B7ECA6|nr:hypothetical protein [Aneurinibacillus migulanus]KIV56467.1 hypothetical protein TS64_09365 [Aneurinibacillus migulanus]KPD08475.1 hypothetical protein AM501_09950 [Aneurinibacillus migulanus]